MKRAILIFCAVLLADAAYADDPKLLDTNSSATWKYSPELVRELRDFLHLIPKETIDSLVAEHMLLDGGFRKAVIYLRSNEFKQLVKNAQQLPEVMAVINFLHLNDSATTTNNLQQPQRQRRESQLFNYIVYSYEAAAAERFNGDASRGRVDMPRLQHVTIVQLLKPESDRMVGDFIAFVQDLLKHLPRDQFVAMINEKRQRSAIFAEFYGALRSEQFKPLVEETMKTTKVKSIIGTLSSHSIDAQSLKAIGFEVISWGPSVEAST